MVFMELGIETFRPARVDPPKNGTEPLSRSGKKVRHTIQEWYSTPKLRDPMQLLHALIVLTDPLLFRIAPSSSVTYTRHRGPSLMTKPRANGQRLAQYASQFASARI